MERDKLREEATLIDVLIDGFEKNEILDGFHWRDLPMPDEDAARKFASLAEEAQAWKGPPLRHEEQGGRRREAWSDLEILQAGRGIMVRVRTPGFGRCWHERATWEGDPMGPIFRWLREDCEASAEA